MFAVVPADLIVTVVVSSSSQRPLAQAQMHPTSFKELGPRSQCFEVLPQG